MNHGVKRFYISFRGITYPAANLNVSHNVKEISPRSPLVSFLPARVVLGFGNLAGGSNSQKNEIWAPIPHPQGLILFTQKVLRFA